MGEQHHGAALAGESKRRLQGFISAHCVEYGIGAEPAGGGPDRLKGRIPGHGRVPGA